MTVDDAAVGVLCVSCGSILTGEYCKSCGERGVYDEDLSLRGFVRNALRDVFDLDARFYRTYRALVSQPGRLTADYVAGRRRPWLSPFHVFIIANFIFFIALLVVPLTALTTPLASQLNSQLYSDFARDLVRARFAAQESADYAGFAARFNLATEQYAKSLVILLVPAVAGIFAVLFAPRREPAGKHLVFALHIVSVLLLLLPVVMLLIMQLPISVRNMAESEGAFVALLVITFLPYTYLATRRAYDAGRMYAGAAAVTLFLLLPVVLLAYRFVLFLVVFHTI